MTKIYGGPEVTIEWLVAAHDRQVGHVEVRGWHSDASLIQEWVRDKKVKILSGDPMKPPKNPQKPKAKAVEGPPKDRKLTRGLTRRKMAGDYSED